MSDRTRTKTAAPRKQPKRPEPRFLPLESLVEIPDQDVEMKVNPGQFAQHSGPGPDLSSFTEVPKEGWHKIPRDTYIRYTVVNSPDNPNRSGFITGIRLKQSKGPEGDINRYQFSIISDLSRGPNTRRWFQNFETITQVWRKSTHVVDVTPPATSSSDELTSETGGGGSVPEVMDETLVSEFRKKIELLESKVQNLENDNKIQSELLRESGVKILRILETFRKIEPRLLPAPPPNTAHGPPA